MSELDTRHTPPPDPGGAGVRVIRTPQRLFSSSRLYTLLALTLVLAGAGYLLFKPVAQPSPTRGVTSVSHAEGAVVPRPDAATTGNSAEPLKAAPRAGAAVHASTADFDLPSLDPDDVAAYIDPNDPEPTAAELIEALNHAGIRGGLGAFTPPGTSPPMHGLAVPDDFELPEGYVRHHQVTDEGEPLEPILMFSPDYELVDAAGRVISLPEDLVVPPEMAPPGMPIRPIEIPGPGE